MENGISFTIMTGRKPVLKVCWDGLQIFKLLPTLSTRTRCRVVATEVTCTPISRIGSSRRVYLLAMATPELLPKSINWRFDRAELVAEHALTAGSLARSFLNCGDSSLRARRIARCRVR